MLLDRNFWAELVRDETMQLDRIKAYSAHVRVAWNNLRSVAMHGDLYGSTGDLYVDKQLCVAMHALREIETHFARLARDSECAGGMLRDKIHAE